MLSITGVMVLPAYLSSMAYLWKICEDGEYPTTAAVPRSGALICSILGSTYALWLIYAAGLEYLLMAVLFLTIGIPVFIWSRKENNPEEKMFTTRETWLAGLMVLISLIAVLLFWRGILTV